MKMKSLILIFFLLPTFFSIQVSSFSSKEITLNTGENTTLSITVVNDRPYALGLVLEYMGSLDVYLPPQTTLNPYETKTLYFTVSVPDNYTGENPSKGYVVVSEKTEGIVSSAILNPVIVSIPDAEIKTGQELTNLAEEIKSSLEKKMENESIVVFPAFSTYPLSPQTYLLLTFPKFPERQSRLLFFIASFFLTSFALLFVFNEITKGRGRV